MSLQGHAHRVQQGHRGPCPILGGRYFSELDWHSPYDPSTFFSRQHEFIVPDLLLVDAECHLVHVQGTSWSMAIPIITHSSLSSFPWSKTCPCDWSDTSTWEGESSRFDWDRGGSYTLGVECVGKIMTGSEAGSKRMSLTRNRDLQPGVSGLCHSSQHTKSHWLHHWG